MKKSNPHIGSCFESWLDDKSLREEVMSSAVKELVAAQLAEEMKKRNITKTDMAELMQIAEILRRS